MAKSHMSFGWFFVSERCVMDTIGHGVSMKLNYIKISFMEAKAYELLQKKSLKTNKIHKGSWSIKIYEFQLIMYD